ncbi:MAG: phospho-N-acetylmuramoyl-pentapeptide-transferase [Oscillospiraceae bacterium]|jgi:phospho-N-acetylmuramoyl-pentapeptide-transferase|nr:phospho-N-acetylmuramoyl-pentapeptide-transferase [Oscillospiraceae bacterium]
MSYAVISILAAGIAFIVTSLLGRTVIPWLQKLKMGQTIKDIGPTWHSSKQGTPTMGGIMFIAGIVLAAAVSIPLYIAVTGSVEFTSLRLVRVVAGVVMGLLFAALGFMDDYISIMKKTNTGLTARQKFLLQLVIAAGYLLSIYLTEDGAGATVIPFLGRVELGIWFYLISLFLIVGFVNAVNLTDGLDGLCSSVTFFAVVVFMLIAGIQGLFEVGILAASVAGGCLGFLIWNFYPAKVFMGDTGSLFLGGMFCAVAYAADMPILIPIAGIVYLCEVGSVMIQQTYYKLTHGKRIFKMTPIHHHFEMMKWSEVKIVAVFSIAGILAGAVAVALSLQ